MSQKFDAERIRAAYINAFSSEDGRIVLFDIMHAAHVFESSYVPARAIHDAPHLADGIASALETAFREGERNMALRLGSMMQWATRDYHFLAEEFRDDIGSEPEPDDPFAATAGAGLADG